ncbi:MAG: ERCC4 domain-containing protein [Candidatus Aenigmatarchaeota archaeon]
MEPPKAIIKIDKREIKSGICEYLKAGGCEIQEERLEVADFIVSDRVAIERKTYADIISSIMDGRLFRQAKEMVSAFERPIILIEGFECFVGYNENMLFGALSALSIDFGISTVWTRNKMESAKFICTAAKREQLERNRAFPIRVKKRCKNLKDEQMHLIAGLPSVNSKLSVRLLDKFGTPRRVFNATKEELLEIEGLGEKKAARFLDLLNCECLSNGEKAEGWQKEKADSKKISEKPAASKETKDRN